METLRQKYAPIITQLQDRIDEVAAAWIVTEKPELLWEYKALVFEMTEIKEAIIDSERSQ